MKITFVMPHAGMAGGNRVIAIYASHLIMRGHSVCVIAQPPDRPTIRDQISSLVRGRPIPKIAKTAPYFKDLGVPLQVLDETRAVTDSDVPDADIIIATWWETAEWVAALNATKGLKVYFIQHHEIFPWLPVERCRTTYLLPLRKIVISRWLQSVMEDEYHQSDVTLIPNSVDQTQFFCAPRQKQTLPTVGFLYSTVPFKGTSVAIEALNLVKARMKSLKAVSFGSEPIASNLPLPDWIEYRHLPPQQEIRAIYASCDAWLCSSRSEGFYLPMLEAMACRCPVVSTKVGGPVDTIVNGVNGYLVEIDDAVGLSEQLIAVLQKTEDQWRRMSDSAFATATQYTWDDAAAHFESSLQHFLRESE